MGDFEAIASTLVKSTYVKQGVQSQRTRHNKLLNLLTHRKIPKEGHDDSTIEYMVQELSVMDSNNFPGNVGVGEREGRVYSSLVARRHFGLSHGIGRSGDIAEQQPKAAGSSIIYKLTNSMACHALELAGFQKPAHALVLPMATGMTLAMCLLTLRAQEAATANVDSSVSTPSTLPPPPRTPPAYVIWPRIDQKSCFKSIYTAGLTPLVVDHALDADGQLRTDVAAVRHLLERHGRHVLCVVSTTSCFAPRQPDAVDELAKLCREFGVGHVINNAYGLQCPVITKLINRAAVVGRVDAVVQSTDKNFLVPVGGAIVSSPDGAFVAQLAKMYPGRAGMGPVLDLFMTLLAMGEQGLTGLWAERQRLLPVLTERLRVFAEARGERLLPCPRNTISIGVTLASVATGKRDGSAGSAGGGDGDATDEAPPSAAPGAESFIGSMLFQRNVSGCRVVVPLGKTTPIGGCDFVNWGAHHGAYPVPYFTAACSIGLTASEIDLFMERLDAVWKKFDKRRVGAGTGAGGRST